MRISLRSDVFLALSTELESHSTYQYCAHQRLFRLSSVNILVVNTRVCVPTVTHSKHIDFKTDARRKRALTPWLESLPVTLRARSLDNEYYLLRLDCG